MEITIRLFEHGDIEFALAQTVREGWDATADLFELCLAHDPQGCFIAMTAGRRAAMITTTRYERSAWIGNLIVPPEHRRRGIGQRLMKHALEHLLRQDVRTIRLEADPLGINTYRRLGFVDDFESPRFLRVPGSRTTQTSSARPLTPNDLPAVAAFDSEFFGDRRGRLLELLLQQSKAAYCYRERGELRGYAAVVAARVGVRIGPCVAADRDVAEALLESILADWCDTTIQLGVPGPNHDAIELLDSAGFRRSPACLRMVYGERAAGGRPANVLAITNGAMG